jgi:hypothetical protein
MAGGPGPIPLDVSKFDVYSLTDISWTVFDSTGKQVHTITGKGTYQLEKVAKGMARRQELTLDISIDGQSPVTLDSGLVLGCSQFPDIVISVRRGSTCFETTMDIAAAPGN